MDTIGKELQPTLKAIEDGLWEYEINNKDIPHGFPKESLKSVTKIFLSVILDEMWKLQTKENFTIEQRRSMALKMADDYKKFIKTYPNIDTRKI